MQKTYPTSHDNALNALIRESEATIANLVQHHVIHDHGRQTALLFINYHSKEPSREWASRYGYTPVPAKPHSKSKGRLVGGEPGAPMAIVVRVAPDSLIELPESQMPCHPPVRLRLRVTPDFGLMQETSLVRSNSDSQTSLHTFHDDELLPFFADLNLPSWLKTILDAQLYYWDKHHAETYYRYTPWPVWGEEFARCIKAAPYWALARWKRKLFPHQIDYCKMRSGAGTVAFCLDRITPRFRNSSLGLYAEDALAHAFGQMTEDEILFCSEKEPFAALRWRRNFPPDLRAKVLAHVVPMDEWDGTELPAGLEEDILESIASFPAVWLRRYGCLCNAMERIAKHLSIQPDGPTALALYERMDPTGRESFRRYLSSRI